MNIPPGTLDSDSRLVIVKNGQQRHINPNSLGLAGYISGLTLSNNATDATNDIDFAAGVAASTGSSSYTVLLASGLTKQLDASWAAGNNAGGRMSAAAIANTTYHCFLIRNSTTGAVDAGFDVSATAPTMPTGYDQYRRIGSIVRAAGAILAFTQVGNSFTWASPAADINTTNPGTSGVTSTLTLPIGIVVEAFGDFYLTTNVAATDFVVYVTALSTPNFTPDTTQYYTLVDRSTAVIKRAASAWRVFSNTSAQIRYRLSASDANTIMRLNTKGWVDTRA